MSLLTPQEERERDARFEGRALKRHRYNAIASAIILFLFFNLPGPLYRMGGRLRWTPGIPHLSISGSPWLDALIVAVLAVILGAPMGYFISRRDMGAIGGAVTGGIVSAAGFLLLSGLCLWNSEHLQLALVASATVGAVPGSAVGLLMGVHVRAGRDL